MSSSPPLLEVQGLSRRFPGVLALDHMNFDVLVDETDAIAGGWDVMGLPTTFFVKADGMVAKVHVGQMTADQLQEYVKLVLPD